jgi:hypothetical protein
MKLGKVLAATAAISLTAAPIAAQAASGVESARSGTQAEGEAIGGSLLLPLLALAALIAVVVVIASDDDESPASP